MGWTFEGRHRQKLECDGFPSTCASVLDVSEVEVALISGTWTKTMHPRIYLCSDCTKLEAEERNLMLDRGWL